MSTNMKISVFDSFESNLFPCARQYGVLMKYDRQSLHCLNIEGSPIVLILS